MALPLIPALIVYAAYVVGVNYINVKEYKKKEQAEKLKESKKYDIQKVSGSAPAKNTNKAPNVEVKSQDGTTVASITPQVGTTNVKDGAVTAEVKGAPPTADEAITAAIKQNNESSDVDGSSATLNESDKLLKAIADEISGSFERQEDLLLGVPYEYLSGSQAEDIESAAEVISNTEYNVDSISRIGFQKHPEKKAFMYITGPKGKILHGEFILEHMGLGSQERSSVQETFSGNFMQIFGSRQKTLSISGGVYDAENFEWATKFEQLYDKRLKASCALKNGEKVYLYINKRVLECYMLSFNMTYSSQEDAMARFNMNIFVKSIKYDIEHDFDTPKPKKEAPPRKMAVTFAGNSTKIESKLKNFPDMIGDYDTRIRTAVNYASGSVNRRMSQAFTKYGGTV